MAKHLIYMGSVGQMHRIALFDTENILARSLPVKDVPVLPENVEYLNCTVKNGIPTPNLKGAKVLCAVPKGTIPTYVCNVQQKYNLKSLWVDKQVKPGYLYGYTKHRIPYDSVSIRFASGFLLSGGATTGCSIWNGMCTENTYYVIAVLCVRKNSKRYRASAGLLCMTHTGALFYSSASDMKIYLNNGATFVQVGTPDLTYPSVYSAAGLCTGSLPMVGLADKDNNKIIWQGRNKLEGIEAEVESVWWNNLYRTTVCDFRKYKNAWVFGIMSMTDACMLIFPESTEELWLGLLQNSPSLKSVYLPPSVRSIHEVGIPVRRIKKITFYSSSPVVAEFCDKYGAPIVACTNADEMLAQFYQASDEDYISVQDANNIAALAGAQSDEIGESGTIWSAALFSLASKGMASETLNEKYPVLDTCDGKYDVPKLNIRLVGVGGGGLCDGHGQYGKERTRTLAAAFTQFYPLSTKECEVTDGVLSYDKYMLGDYSLYVGVNAFNSKRFTAVQTYRKEMAALPPNTWRHNVRAPDKAEVGEAGALNHVALLVNDIGIVIHRFECNDNIVGIMRNLESAAMDDAVPCGVLRYADKLPVLYKWTWRDDEQKQVLDALFRTFLVFSYSTKTVRRQLVGIDLHTGALATADYTVDSTAARKSDYGYSVGRTVQKQFFVSVNRLSNIKLHSLDADLSSLFAKDCVYNMNK